MLPTVLELVWSSLVEAGVPQKRLVSISDAIFIVPSGWRAGDQHAGWIRLLGETVVQLRLYCAFAKNVRVDIAEPGESFDLLVDVVRTFCLHS